ncbi:MAG: 6-carboxytetrahydropterin synthase [Acidiphilium sp.]|nr:6-carboxytetrahydropterin synthase [Acidiphilium sp.]MDD4935895.1 6-carboxytetrahydropterin synthase [Acidiphilium sp.]
MFTISKEFRFEAAHTLNRAIETEASRRIHGHSYRATVTLRGEPGTDGMVMDFGVLGRHLARLRDALDHRFLDEVADLGPATLENLARFIWSALYPACPTLTQVRVSRDSEGESCIFRGPGAP